MVVFAWILWGLILASWGIRLIMIVCATLAFSDGREVKIQINEFTFIFKIAVFVFLTIYLFL